MTKHLKGSVVRDAFKYQHKQPPMPFDFCASDLDLMLIELQPSKRVIAAIDVKVGKDNITKTEEVLYDWLNQQGLKVYLVHAKKPEDIKIGAFIIAEYGIGPVAQTNNWQDFAAWEREIREEDQHE